MRLRQKGRAGGPAVLPELNNDGEGRSELGGRRKLSSSSSFVSSCPRAGGAVAGMKFPLQSCQPDGQISPLPLLRVWGGQAGWKRAVHRGEEQLCVSGVPSAASAGLIPHSYIPQAQLLGSQGSWARVLAFSMSLWIRNTEHSSSRFIITFPTVTLGL